jgi:hypothetical protein
MQDAANIGFTAPQSSPAAGRSERERIARTDHAPASTPGVAKEDQDLFLRAVGQFREIQTATEEPQRLWRALITICVVAALLGIVAAATFYYTRSENVLGELLDSGKLRTAQVFPASSPVAAGPTTAPRLEAATSTPPAEAAPTSAPVSRTVGTPGVAESRKPLRAESYKPKLTRTKSLRPRHKVAFKSAFGHVITTRTYVSKAMKRKAQAMWDREGKILEPDGSVFIPYKKPTVSEPRPIPGH